MDFDLPPEAETYRDEVRAFVREHAPGGRFPDDWNRRLATSLRTGPSHGGATPVLCSNS
jgi:hypothetical protein